MISRDAWEPLEVLHAIAYFAPEPDAALKATGLRGFWMGYFAARAAPLGAVGPEVVTAVFHGFPFEAVARSLPDAWSYAAPARAWDARRDGSVAALQRVLGASAAGSDVAMVADLGRRVVAAARYDGRALAAATAGMAWPDDPLAVAWQVATVLREHRGDGHVALLTAADLDGSQANVLAAARGATTLGTQRRARAWSDDAWRAAEDALEERGIVADGALTSAGRALAVQIEERTDELAAPPYDALTGTEQEALVSAARRLATLVIQAGELPFPNAIALPRPSWADGTATR